MRIDVMSAEMLVGDIILAERVPGLAEGTGTVSGSGSGYKCRA